MRSTLASPLTHAVRTLSHVCRRRSLRRSLRAKPKPRSPSRFAARPHSERWCTSWGPGESDSRGRESSAREESREGPPSFAPKLPTLTSSPPLSFSAEFGGWNAAEGIALTWTEGDVWVGQASLPPSLDHEFKCVLSNATTKQVTWEKCSNRHLDTMIGNEPVAASVVELEWDVAGLKMQAAEPTSSDDEERPWMKASPSSASSSKATSSEDTSKPLSSPPPASKDTVEAAVRKFMTAWDPGE